MEKGRRSKETKLRIRMKRAGQRGIESNLKSHDRIINMNDGKAHKKIEQ